MATYADNDVYIALGGTAVSAYFRRVAPSFTNADVDTTAGAGTEHVERAPGLNDTSFEIELVYDAADLQTYIQKIAVGQTISFEYGSEGAVSGKPRHVQNVVVTKNDHRVVVAKETVAFSISLKGAAAPSVDMNAGGVYS